eukprot:gb/GECG01000142.1/.p1 GENE.gb/GECG01000142.1/~~gb/GECG01000142.1/.p1  ORF type:complete len:214 (+),score=26.24 gb/GECG01000142.1/:1-642(+)
MSTVARDIRNVTSSKRVQKACKPCSKSKTKCDEARPCQRCVRKGIPSECVDELSRMEKRRRANEEQLGNPFKSSRTLPDNRSCESGISLVDWILASTRPHSSAVTSTGESTTSTNMESLRQGSADDAPSMKQVRSSPYNEEEFLVGDAAQWSGMEEGSSFYSSIFPEPDEHGGTHFSSLNRAVDSPFTDLEFEVSRLATYSEDWREPTNADDS